MRGTGVSGGHDPALSSWLMKDTELETVCRLIQTLVESLGDATRL